MPKVGKVVKKLTPKVEERAQGSPTRPYKVYLKAMPLRSLEDVQVMKQEVEAGNILILKVSPLARKSIEDVKHAIGELYEFAQSVGADIARLGEERVVVTPPSIKIWREKSSKEKTLSTVT